MIDVESLRLATDEDVTLAVSDVGEAFPIRDAASLTIVIGRLFGAPVTPGEVLAAIVGSYVGLPLEGPAEVREAFNRFLDLKFGEPEE